MASRTRRLPNLPWLAGLGGMALLLAVWLVPALRPSHPTSQPAPVPREALVLNDGVLQRRGANEAFSGVMIERHPNGTLKSRSAVVEGRLEGLSEGWYADGGLQVREGFVAGVSDGIRTKWFPNGRKRTEAVIVQGKLHGTFRRWHENGVMAEEVGMRDGKPHGIARSWYPSGWLRSRAVTNAGEVEKTESWPDGTMREEVAEREAADAPS
ncbi:MAG: toxin-antitoxin system YwqK family antitoxin [Verrucomicrobiales bacterium]|nr:toxin-antitoxin system YwqK family antitoxin [Verrucomicrobiales bacterium]